VIELRRAWTRGLPCGEPIYLESLKTYEHFATSDSLFSKAIDRFALRSCSSQAIESLKKRVLKVEIVRNTRILEIGATLPEARKHRRCALSAESTVEMNRSMVTEGDRICSRESNGRRARCAQLQEADVRWRNWL